MTDHHHPKDHYHPKDHHHPKDFYERVYEVVARIPKGKVTTYGAIARYLGTGGSARMVGWALNKTLSKPMSPSFERSMSLSIKPLQTLPMLPCHRVVNRTGELTGKAWFGGNVMEELLRSEGVTFDDQCRVDLDRHFWQP